MESIHNKLIEGGTALMPLDKYPWSDKYVWIVDQFGMSWQLTLGELPEDGQKIITSFLFVGKQYGKAQDAIKHYTSIFPNSAVHHLEKAKAGEIQPEGDLKFGSFSLDNETFAAMDGFGDHKFEFNEGLSIMVECETQDDIDRYWNRLTEGGEESRCGWLKDRFGVSWQIVPKVLGSLMKDQGKAQRVMAEVMKMKKLDMQTMVNA
jgi:predicted 3-demethylubiquinone-9 3-methyltransferase (glyoxalase superfamily)